MRARDARASAVVSVSGGAWSRRLGVSASETGGVTISRTRVDVDGERLSGCISGR